MKQVLRDLQIFGRPEIVYAKDVVQHQTDPLAFLSELLEIASEAVIVRCRTRDRGTTEWDPERSCQYHYGGWMPYIVINLHELIESIMARMPDGEVVVYRHHMVLGGQYNRFVPKELYLKETGTAETAVGIFKRTAQAGKVTVEDRIDRNPCYTWDYLLKHAARQMVACLLHVVGFEPDAEEASRLQQEAVPPVKSWTHLPYGLGERDGCGTLHLCRDRGNSSFYRSNRAFLDRFPDAERFDVVGTEVVTVRSLDSLLEDPSVTMPGRVDFLKIDTQGFALDILRGAKATLINHVVALQVEVEFARLYESQPVFREVDAFLAECGFQLFKLRRLEWVRRPLARQPAASAGQVVFADAFYLRDPLNPEYRWTPRDAHQAEALVLVALLYDAHDLVLELLATPQFSELLAGDTIKAYVEKRTKRLLHPWRRIQNGRDVAKVIVDALRRLGRINPYRSLWARGDDNFYSIV
jgi:FkbM family methyltransferase